MLDMGEPVRIHDLATRMIRLSGQRPGADVEVRVTSVRPGEKLDEQLHDPEEADPRHLTPVHLPARPVRSRADGARSMVARWMAAAEPRRTTEAVHAAIAALALPRREQGASGLPRSAQASPTDTTVEGRSMDLISYLRILQRRWLLLVVPPLARCPGHRRDAAATETRRPPARDAVQRHRDADRLAEQRARALAVNLATVALFAGLGEVPQPGCQGARLRRRAADPGQSDGGAPRSPTRARSRSVPPVADPDDGGRCRRRLRRGDRRLLPRPASQPTRGRASVPPSVGWTTLDRATSGRRRQGSPRRRATRSLQARVIALQDAVLHAVRRDHRPQPAARGRRPARGAAAGVAIPQATATTFTAPSSPLARLGISALLGLLLGARPRAADRAGRLPAPHAGSRSRRASGCRSGRDPVAAAGTARRRTIVSADLPGERDRGGSPVVALGGALARARGPSRDSTRPTSVRCEPSSSWSPAPCRGRARRPRWPTWPR